MEADQYENNSLQQRRTLYKKSLGRKQVDCIDVLDQLEDILGDQTLKKTDISNNTYEIVPTKLETRSVNSKQNHQYFNDKIDYINPNYEVFEETEGKFLSKIMEDREYSSMSIRSSEVLLSSNSRQSVSQNRSSKSSVIRAQQSPCLIILSSDSSRVNSIQISQRKPISERKQWDIIPEVGEIKVDYSQIVQQPEIIQKVVEKTIVIQKKANKLPQMIIGGCLVVCLATFIHFQGLFY